MRKDEIIQVQRWLGGAAGISADGCLAIAKLAETEETDLSAISARVALTW